MSLATEMQDDIAELLDDPDIGRDITSRRVTAGTYNPADGSTAAATVTTVALRALLLGYADKMIDGTLIKRGDRRCYLKLKDASYTPLTTDEVIVGADKFSIVDFKTIELAGTAIIYILQIRR